MFDADEKTLIRLHAATRDGADRFWSYASVLVAPVLMALYGIVQREYVAVSVAFAGLLAMVVWAVFRDLRHAGLYRQICRKIIAADLLDGQRE